jgi:hypothetical protein
MSDQNGVTSSVEEVPDSSPSRAAASTRIGCNDLLRNEDGSIASITFEFRKLEEKFNRLSASGSSQSQPGFEERYDNIPEASDVLDDASASAIAQQQVARLEGSQSGVSFKQAIESWAKTEAGIKVRFPTSPEGSSFRTMEAAVIKHRGKYKSLHII